MKNILLTSTGTTSQKAKEAVLNRFPNLPNKKVVMITTASKDKENNKWNIITRDQLIELGYEKVDFLDLEFKNQIDLSDYGTIYVCGGNTFKLMKYVAQSNFKDEVIKCLDRGGLYIGTSAGSIIVTPTIRIAGEIDPDENSVNLTNLEGMNLVDFEILPHYSPENDAELEAYKKKTSREIKLISNDDIWIY
jgi:dipeptidase E